MHERIIKTVGIGGSGANIITLLSKKKIKNCELSVVDTDKKILSRLPANLKSLLIGENITRGSGTLCKCDKGLLSAYSSKIELVKFLIDSRIILLVSGLGGGTGSGSLPIIASICKDLHIYTIGVFTVPYQWEGNKRLDNANHSIEESAKYFNSLFIIKNDDILYTNKAKIDFKESFIIVNNHLYRVINWILSSLKKSPELFI